MCVRTPDGGDTLHYCTACRTHRRRAAFYASSLANRIHLCRACAAARNAAARRANQRRPHYRMLRSLRRRERGCPLLCTLAEADVAALVQDVFAGRSVLSGRSDPPLVLTRWRRDAAFTVGNAVLLTADEAALHARGRGAPVPASAVRAANAEWARLLGHAPCGSDA